MKLSLIPVTLLTGALMLITPNMTFAQNRGGGGGHSSGGRSFSAPRGGGGGTARSFSGGQRGPSIQRGGQSFSRGFAPGGARGFVAPYRYGYRGGAYYGYYGAPYHYGGYYGPSYYGNYCGGGYYDQWGRWIPNPACYAPPYYPY
jgi:hypothetical protein